MGSLRQIVLGTACLALGAFLVAGAAYAQSGDAASSAAEFKRAYDSALTGAAGNDTLDPAYELLGVAGNARERNAKDMANGAADAFAQLIQRATAAALKKGGSVAQDTLDQMVDLRFFAETTQLEKTTTALDVALRTLFPAVAKANEQRIDTAANWDDRVSALRDLIGLQASATQIKLDDVAASLAVGVDTRLTGADAVATADPDTAERARKAGEVEELKRARVDQLNEATANNINAVAKQMQSSGRTAGSSQVTRSEAETDVPEDMAEGDGSCMETGYRTKRSAAGAQSTPDASRRAHDRDCINSGRVPATSRCSTDNLTMVCYSAIQDGERITYIYSDTPADSYFRKSCPAGDVLAGNKVPKDGAPFRSSDIKLAFVCAPAGSDISGD